MNVGPTVRIVRFCGSADAVPVSDAVVDAWPWDVPAGPRADPARFAASDQLGVSLRGCARDFAFSSVTTISPGAPASLIGLSASAQLCPGRRQLHEGMNSFRYRNALASSRYVRPLPATA